MTPPAWLSALPWAWIARVIVAVCIYAAGHMAGSEVGKATVLRAERDAARRDLAVTSKMTEAGRVTSAALEKAQATRSGRVRKYAERNKTAGGCSLTDDDVRRMRDIVGK